MATAPTHAPSRQKVREHRARLREQGLRPIQIWVPDVRSPGFQAEAHRQSLAVAGSKVYAGKPARLSSSMMIGSTAPIR